MFKNILGRRYNRTKKAQGAPAGNANAEKQKDQNDPVDSTATKLGKEHGVSPATVKRAELCPNENPPRDQLRGGLCNSRPRNPIPGR